MTALEVFSAPIVRSEPSVQYDEARRTHQRNALIAHVADKHQDWEAARAREAVIREFGKTELSPSKTNLADWTEPV